MAQVRDEARCECTGTASMTHQEVVLLASDLPCGRLQRPRHLQHSAVARGLVTKLNLVAKQ